MAILLFFWHSFSPFFKRIVYGTCLEHVEEFGIFGDHRCNFVQPKPFIASMPIAEIVSGIVIPMLFFSALLVYFLYRKHLEQVGLDKAWIANWVDLKVMRPDDGQPPPLRAKKSRESNVVEGASMGASMGESDLM